MGTTRRTHTRRTRTRGTATTRPRTRTAIPTRIATRTRLTATTTTIRTIRRTGAITPRRPTLPTTRRIITPRRATITRTEPAVSGAVYSGARSDVPFSFAHLARSYPFVRAVAGSERIDCRAFAGQ